MAKEKKKEVGVRGVTLDPLFMLDDGEHDPDAALSVSSDISVGASLIPHETRRAIIQAKSEGIPTKVIALQCGVEPASVQRIWKAFIDENNQDALANQEEAAFKRSIRRKAIRAIEAGLECDRDPYRQMNGGIQVMKGIGEFKSDDGGGGNRVAILIGNLPPDWKSRYIGG